MADYDVALFDLDGTLTESEAGITNSVAHALRALGAPVPGRETLLKFIGPPLLESFERLCGFSRAEAARAVERYREYYETRGLFENAVYEGVPQMLETLSGAGVRLAIATSKPEPFAVRIAEAFGIGRYFEFIGGATMEETRTEKREVIRYVLETMGVQRRKRAVMVGDREHDVLGAAACGIDCIGVLFGYGTAEELRRAGCKALAATPAEAAARILGG